MLGIFNSLFRSVENIVAPSYLGVDIGTTSIKVVEVAAGKELPQVLNYALLESSGHLMRENKVLQTSTMKLFEQEVSELLQMIVKRMDARTSVAVASLPSFAAFITILQFPVMDPKELMKSIGYQARQYVPMPLSEVAIDWLKVGEYEDESGTKKMLVLLIAVPQEHIVKYQKIFKSAGLTLRALEVESICIRRSLIGNDPTSTIMLDIGSRSTNIAFFSKGQLTFNAQSDFAGATLTQALASSLNISPLRAEELKKERGVAGGGANYELSTIITPYMDAIINEVKRALYEYQIQLPTGAKMERIILAGGSANLLGVEKYIGDGLALPIAKAQPFTRFEYPVLIEPLITELGPYMSVALGLTLREFEE